MSANLLNIFGDESPDLHKQIGCMTGIFHMFDRQHLLSSRPLSVQNHKGPLPPANLDIEPHSHFRSSNWNQRGQMESSRGSLSSSSYSSSFSSIECGKSTQQESVTSEQASYNDISVRNSRKSLSGMKSPDISRPSYMSANTSVQPGSHSLDFRDVVKGSIYRETQGLSVKTLTIDEVKKNVVKHRKSPRLTTLSKSVDGSCVSGINGNPRMSLELNEPVIVLKKVKDAPSSLYEPEEPSRPSYDANDSSKISLWKEVPRFSCEEWEFSRMSFDSEENDKSTFKFCDIPRLSLDSREASIQSSHFFIKSNSVCKNMEKSKVNKKISKTLASLQDSGSEKRPPSVVAKLMGLEAMPHASNDTLHWHETLKSSKDVDAFESQKKNNFSLLPMSVAGKSKQGLPSSSKRAPKDSVTPVKLTSNPRIPNETAPWKQHEKVHGSLRTGPVYKEMHGRQQHESVYGEIKGKLNELEFEKSNRDLRALKQILDAIQAKGPLEVNKDRTEAFNQKTSQCQTSSALHQDVRKKIQHGHLTIPTSGTLRPLESPIVIMKPAKLVSLDTITPKGITFEGDVALQKVQIDDHSNGNKVSVKKQTVKDRTPRKDSKDVSHQLCISTVIKSRNKIDDSSLQKSGPRAQQCSTMHQTPSSDSSGNLTKASSSLSPRIQQKKLLEKKSCLAVPPSQSKNVQMKIKQSPESVTPRSKLRMKKKSEKQHECQCNGINTEASKHCYPSENISLRSDGNLVLESPMHVEVTNVNRSSETASSFCQGGLSPSVGGLKNSYVKKKNFSQNLREKDSSSELPIINQEQPSPVSVLDVSLHTEDELSGSPKKNISYLFKNKNTPNSGDVLFKDSWKSTSKFQQSNLTTDIDHTKLRKIESLVQKLRELTSSNDDEESTDHIASLYETENPDYKYVLEILLASGLLLKDLNGDWGGMVPIQLHHSYYVINPNLFQVLEQKKSRRLPKIEAICDNGIKLKMISDKIHRKLIFDAVNEILVHKLECRSHQPISSFRAGRLARKTPTGQHLIKDLCLEIEKLKTDYSRGSSLNDEENSLKSILSRDLLLRSDSWNDPSLVIPGVVLDMERSIFKGLIDEVVCDESVTGLIVKSRRRRQLFVN